MTRTRWAVLSGLGLLLVGLVVAITMTGPPSSRLAGTGDNLPGLLPGSAAYVVSCVDPTTIVYQGSVDDVTTWVDTPPQESECWTTYYVTPSDTTTTTSTSTTTTVPDTTTSTSTTSTTVPPTTTTTTLTPLQQAWKHWCSTHPTFYDPRRCPTHLKKPKG